MPERMRRRLGAMRGAPVSGGMLLSRLRRRKPLAGVSSCESEKDDERMWHRIFRRVNRQLAGRGAGSGLLRLEGEVSNRWAIGKDGKQRLSASE